MKLSNGFYKPKPNPRKVPPLKKAKILYSDFSGIKEKSGGLESEETEKAAECSLKLCRAFAGN